MFDRILGYYRHLIDLFYPNFCALCHDNLLKNESTLCTICEVKLPFTNYHNIPNNPIEKKLWGRVSLQRASSLLFFEKGMDVQNLISQLKYKKRQDIGTKLAEIYANQLLDSDYALKEIDVIIPIPLHFKKYKKRTYNQCHTFCEMLSEKLGIPKDFETITRKVNTQSQTGKNRIDRWENVSDIFQISNTKELENKHVLIVDDVITTGATIEAISNQILEIKGTKISIILMASAI